MVKGDLEGKSRIDSGFEEEEEDNKEMEKIGLSPFLGLAVGSMLVGTSVGCCQAR